MGAAADLNVVKGDEENSEYDETEDALKSDSLESRSTVGVDNLRENLGWYQSMNANSTFANPTFPKKG